MPNIIIAPDKDTVTEFKQCIIKYLEGMDIATTKLTLRKICTTAEGIEYSAKGLCKAIAIRPKNSQTLDEDIKNILRHLSLPTESAPYTDTPSLYHLLRRLRHEGHERLDCILELIDNTKTPSAWLDHASRPLITAIGLLSFCYIQPQYFWNTLDWLIEISPIAYHWVYDYAAQLNTLPLVGMGVQLLWLWYYLNDTYEYGTDISEERIRHLLFKTLNISLNFFAHLISYWAAGTLPLLPAILFISASCVDMIKSLTSAWYQPQPNGRLPQDPTLHDKANDAGFKHIPGRNHRVLLIECIYASAVTVLVILWCTLPPSVILTMIYMLSMLLTSLVKDLLITTFKNESNNDLQTTLTAIYSVEARATEQQKQKAAFKAFAVDKITPKRGDDAQRDSLLSKMESIVADEHFELDKAKSAFDEFIANYNTISNSILATPGTGRGRSLFSTPQRGRANTDPTLQHTLQPDAASASL